jgi:hypothetical protein
LSKRKWGAEVLFPMVIARRLTTAATSAREIYGFDR